MNQWINHLINEPMDKSIINLINRAMSKSIGQYISNQSTDQSFCIVSESIKPRSCSWLIGQESQEKQNQRKEPKKSKPTTVTVSSRRKEHFRGEDRRIHGVYRWHLEGSVAGWCWGEGQQDMCSPQSPLATIPAGSWRHPETSAASGHR